MSDTLSPVVSELDELVDHLECVRARAANAFATETHFFANVARLVERRERERAAQAADGSTVHGTQLGMREVYAEIAAALRLSEYQVAARVSAASVMMEHFHETLCDVSDGRISPQHAQAIADAGIEIHEEGVRAEYERHARDIATELTSAQLRDALDGLVSRLDPDGTKERIRNAVAERGVRLRHLRAGLSRVSIDLPTAQAVGTVNRLGEMADEILSENRTIAATAARAAVAAQSGGDERPAPQPDQAGLDATADGRTKRQIEADIAADLLLTSAPEGHGVSEHTRSTLSAIRPTVQITIPAGVVASAARSSAALAGGSFGRSAAAHGFIPAGTAPGNLLDIVSTTGAGLAEIAGHGPVDDATALELAGAADGWTRVFTEPSTGVPVNVDRYRPTKRQRRFLAARDLHCRFPGCRRPAAQCDVDHTHAHADGGPTDLCNLAYLCERHHTVKHHTDWSVVQLPGGVLQWTSPTRRVQHTRPPSSVRFVASPHPPGSEHASAPF